MTQLSKIEFLYHMYSRLRHNILLQTSIMANVMINGQMFQRVGPVPRGISTEVRDVVGTYDRMETVEPTVTIKCCPYCKNSHAHVIDLAKYNDPVARARNSAIYTRRAPCFGGEYRIML